MTATREGVRVGVLAGDGAAGDGAAGDGAAGDGLAGDGLAGDGFGCAAVGELDGAGLEDAPLEVLERSLVRGWAEQTAHLARWLMILAVFDRREGWGGVGFTSCAHWLSIHCGISPATAADHVRVARRLEGLGAVRAEFGSGRLSYSKVRALCRVATPDTEAELLELAHDVNAGQLERVLRFVERQRDGGGLSEEELEERRGVSTWTGNDGLVRIELTVYPEEAELIKRGMDFGREQLYRERRTAAKDAAAAAGRGVTPERVEAPSRVESLAWTVGAGLQWLEDNPTLSPGSPYLIVLHAEEGAAFVEDDGQVNLGNGLTIPANRFRQLACESMVRLMVEGRSGNERSPLDMGRTKRLITPRQRAALLSVFDTCDFEGCNVPARFCQWHHIDHWIRGGHTDRSNLRPMCRRHHRVAHTTGTRVVIGPRDRLIALRADETIADRTSIGLAAAVGDRAMNGSELVACNAAAGVHVGNGDALVARWGGAPIDAFATNVIVEHIVGLFDEPATATPWASAPTTATPWASAPAPATATPWASAVAPRAGAPPGRFSDRC